MSRKRLSALLLIAALAFSLASPAALAAEVSDGQVKVTQSGNSSYVHYTITGEDKTEEVVLFRDGVTAASYFLDYTVPNITFVFPPSVSDLSNFNTYNYDYVTFYGGSVRFAAVEGNAAQRELSPLGAKVEIVPAPYVSVLAVTQSAVRFCVSAELLAAVVGVSYHITLLGDGGVEAEVDYDLTAADALYDHEFTLDGLSPGTAYELRVEKTIAYDFGVYQAEGASQQVFTQRSPEQKVEIADLDVRLEKWPLEGSYNVRSVGTYTNWEGVSNVSQFLDGDGHFGFAYADGDVITIFRTDSGAVTGWIEIPQDHDIFGGVYCDDGGNYWVVEGDVGTAAGDQTITISKYSSDGIWLGAVSDAGTGSADQFSDAGAREPFVTGNCDIAEQNGILLVNFGKSMYNGHQASANVGVRMDSMEKVYFDFYNSHSFANAVIPYDGTGGFALLSQGDCFPRAFRFAVTDGTTTLNTLETFHFWVEDGAFDEYDMYKINRTYSHSGGIVEMSTGLLFAGTSARSMSSEAKTEKEDAFFQIFDPMAEDAEQAMQTSGTRSGLAGNNGRDWTTDYGVQWLPLAETGGTVSAPKAVKLDDDLAVILYSLDTTDASGAASHGICYAIVDAWGEVLKQETIQTSAQLIVDESLVYADGSVWWVMNGTGGKTYLYQLSIPLQESDRWANPYADVSEQDGFYPAVEFVCRHGLFTGVSETAFAPWDSLTRAMFVTVLGRLEGVDPEKYTHADFQDTVDGQWYTPYVAWAAEQGIVLGYGNGCFAPGDPLTIEQAVAIMARYARYTGLSLDSGASLAGYQDGGQVSSWASEQMQWAVKNEIYVGDNGNLHAKDSAKRYQAADILYRYLRRF